MNIQITKIYKESFYNVSSHKTDWLKIAYGPLLLWALGVLLLVVAFISSGHPFEIRSLLGMRFVSPAEGTVFLGFAYWVNKMTYFIAITSLYINGYRYAILKDGTDRLITLNLNMRFVKIILYGLLIFLLGGLYIGGSVGIVLMGVGGAHALLDNIAGEVTVMVILGSLLTLYGFYIVFRIVLYPVAISIDQREALKTSWRLMNGNILRFLGLSILVTLTIGLIGLLGFIILLAISMLLSLFVAGLIAWLLSLTLWMLFAVFMTLFLWAVHSKMMGLVYQELSSQPKGKARGKLK